ncbi:MAG: DUF4959 domain-containing protein [Prevotellaceae bacterium]|jgi:hypothetical protein|nr:DUF4959 domain-containing protein [Prevotellaceae bacterium]
MKAKIFIAAFLLAASCGEADMNAPFGNKTPPEKVTLRDVKNMPGAAVIFYDRPADVNLKYVRAVYTVDGEQRVTNASYYTDSILVEGFSDTTEQWVNLYSVSYGDAASEPVPVAIHPRKPSYLHVIDMMQIEETYGGIRITSTNELGAPIAYGVCKWEETDSVTHDSGWVEKSMIYSKAVNFSYALRKQKPVEAKFAVFTKDRWGRRSSLKEATVTPWEEYQCDPKTFAWYETSFDTPGNHTYSGSHHGTPALWDDQVGKSGSYGYHSPPASTFPQMITIDLGKKYTLSRIVLHGRFIFTGSRTDILDFPKTGIGGGNVTDYRYIFKDGYPKNLEIWGRGDGAPNRNNKDLSAQFTKIGDFSLPRADGSFVPSTVSAQNNVGDLSSDDIDLIVQGQEFQIPGTFSDPVRYIVINVLETYGSNTSGPVMIDQLSFFGAEVR